MPSISCKRMRGIAGKKKLRRRRNDGSIKEKKITWCSTGLVNAHYDPTLAFMRYDSKRKRFTCIIWTRNSFDLHQEGKGILKLTARARTVGSMTSEDIVTAKMIRKAYEQGKRGELHPLTYGLLHACLKIKMKVLAVYQDLIKENEWIDLPPE